MAKGERLQTFGETVGGGAFHSDEERIQLGEVLDVQVKVLDGEVRESREFGNEYALLYVEDTGGKRGVVLCGGQVVVRKVRQAKREGLLPLLGTLTRVTGDTGREYYDII